MNWSEANLEELYEKYMPGLWRLSKELGLSVEATMMLVSVYDQAWHNHELNRMREDRKRLEIAFKEYKNKVEAYKNGAEAWV